jgi:hypothetical protein
LQVGGEFWEVDSDVILPGGKPFSGVPPTTIEEKTPGASQSAIKLESDKGRSHGVSLLLANDPSNQVVVGQAIVTGELSLIPSGPEAIKRQQRVQLAMDSTVKRAGIKTWNDTSGVDPELAQMQREKERKKAKTTTTTRGQATWTGRPPTGRTVGGGGGGRKSGGRVGGRRAARGDSFSDSEGEGGIGAPAGVYGGSGYQADGFVVSGVWGWEGEIVHVLNATISRSQISDEDDDVRGNTKQRSKSSKRRNRDFDSDDDDEDAGAAEEEDEEDEEEEMDVEETPEPMTELERAEAAVEKVERQRRKARMEEKKNKTPKSKAPKSAAVVDGECETCTATTPPALLTNESRRRRNGSR